MRIADILIRRLTPADATIYRAPRQRALAEHPEAYRSSADEEAIKSLAWSE
jgi:hypothetical protein